MSTTSAAPQATIQAGYEPIPGYRIESLLGRGGFGEVWKCEAPGGLKKAIKFVYGAMDQDRATRELKSLNRIKSVQHPFLLTLERFEFIEGRLVIVTELADGSLEDEFTERRTRGSCGIPREQLLSSLSDAADALDYLHQRHGLLHLDVKPGNLLVLGGHVKVADFGLLKDLKELECSIVGGLTPVYAPPELFDGRPSLHSDQYSLAIMYQEMLTGVRPFSGRTIAQLATQHVHATPNLTPLLPADRPIIARALEKNPDRRFPSCRELIAALKHSGDRPTKLSSSPSAAVGNYDQRGTDTDLGQFPSLVGGPAVKVDDLPSLDVGSELVKHHADSQLATKHALVIALGGMGLECLQKLSGWMSQPMESVPLVVHGLAIDTDAELLQQIGSLDSHSSVPTIQPLYVPLRKPHEYREIQGERLRSISRRWVFNVPRGGHTEGMRPLGRLALVDHGQKVMQAIGESVKRYCEVNRDQSPAVYVVGSLDGGTASGMIFDVVHLLRHWLDKYGLEHANVLPLLTTRAFTQSCAQTLAGHNAACALDEMRHLIKISNGYPGDSAVQWPSVPAARSPLNDAYLIASDRDGTATPPPAETLAHYIWLDSIFAGEVLDSARATEAEQRLEDLASPSLRSVGLVRLGIRGTIEESLHAPLIAAELLRQWTGDDRPSFDVIEAFHIRESTDDRLGWDALMRSCLGSWSDDRQARTAAIHDWYHSLPAAVLADPKAFNAELIELADRTLGTSVAQDHLSVYNSMRCNLLQELAHRRLSLPAAVQWLDRVLAGLKEGRSIAESHCNAPTDYPADDQTPSPDDMIAMSERWLWRSACQIAIRVYDALIASVTSTQDRFRSQQVILRRCWDSLNHSLETNGATGWEAMSETWRTRANAAVRRLNGRVAPKWLLAPLLNRKSETPSKGLLVTLLEDAAAIATSLRLGEDVMFDGGGDLQTSTCNFNIPGWSEGGEGQSGNESVLRGVMPVAVPTNVDSQPIGSDDQAMAKAAVAAVRPKLLDCGGGQRLILFVGEEADRQRWEPAIREAHSGSLTTVMIAGTAATLVCEAQRIRLGDVRSRIIAMVGGREDVTGRLHTRCDVSWS